MSIWSTDFSTYTTGQFPDSGWTAQWDSSTSDYSVEAGSGLGSKQLVVDTTATGQHLASWDDAGTPTDLKVLFKTQSPSAGGDSFSPGIAFRASGTGASDEDGYILKIDDFFNRIDLAKIVNGSVSNIATSSTISIAKGVWYWLRMEASGTSLKCRVWIDGNSEPGTWNIDITDSTHTGGGWVGMYGNNGDGYLDYISLATGTDEPVDPLATTTTTSTTTTSSTTTTTAAAGGYVWRLEITNMNLR